MIAESKMIGLGYVALAKQPVTHKYMLHINLQAQVKIWYVLVYYRCTSKYG